MDELLNLRNRGSSSWGTRNETSDIRSRKRYKAILEFLGDVGEICFLGFLAFAVLLMANIARKGNFETIIFYDGTENYCVYDNESGEVVPLPHDFED